MQLLLLNFKVPRYILEPLPLQNPTFAHGLDHIDK